MAQSLEDSHMPRKLFHMVWASIIPTLYHFELLPRYTVVVGVVALTFVWLVFELLRLRVPLVNKYFQGCFAPLMKKKEAVALTGVTYMLFGTSISLLAFSPEVASAALYFIALGDPVAAIVGKAVKGGAFVNGKTLAGSLAMFLACGGVGSFVIGFGFIVFIGALTATVAELFAGANWLDDNMVVPVASGATMTFAGVL